MCELFGLSSEHPVRLHYELTEFATHGGTRFRNRDGWGIVFAQPRDAYLFKEPSEGATSALEGLVAEHPPEAQMVLAHVRRATAGQPALCNTHPFIRIIKGKTHSFAHNGDLPALKAQYSGSLPDQECVGDTDSELAFMILLARLNALGERGDAAERFAVFGQFCTEMRPLGDANFLYAEGERLFVHSDRRQYEERDGTLGPSREPGLHICEIPRGAHSWRVKGAGFYKEQAGAQILVASVPLEEGVWQDLPRGTTLWLEHGAEVMRG